MSLGKILAAVNKFHNLYERLQRTPRSGTTPKDMEYIERKRVLGMVVLRCVISSKQVQDSLWIHSCRLRGQGVENAA
ncbi:hypothetical protein Scep_007303 [Stephania cephalantha]|uniref:Uncharacterized protein n=1 Tax=Stephania cephalantha TaxID=152367 RepID=A0AAP0K9R2_9MAGN